jgi:hypothetical protein
VMEGFESVLDLSEKWYIIISIYENDATNLGF